MKQTTPKKYIYQLIQTKHCYRLGETKVVHNEGINNIHF